MSASMLRQMGWSVHCHAAVAWHLHKYMHACAWDVLVARMHVLLVACMRMRLSSGRGWRLLAMCLLFAWVKKGMILRTLFGLAHPLSQNARVYPPYMGHKRPITRVTPYLYGERYAAITRYVDP